MFRGVIFDMDGVLVDNRDAHFNAFKVFCARYGFECRDETLLPLFGKGNDEILPGILPREFIEEKGMENLSEEKEEIYRDLIARTITPADGLVDFLDDIRSHGILTAVGSSGPSVNVNFVLDKCGIADRFDAIANGDMVEHAKPDPAIFLLAAELLGLPAGDCVVIEDSFAGFEAANKAGTKLIGIATTYPIEKLREGRTDMLIHSFRELSYDNVAALWK
ncbi:MAG: HAD family phosphatase [Rikenellaceae bacterium]|nr:HAD family phosphatase [Rikenellaceae bacterium]